MTERWRGRRVKLLNQKAWFLFLLFLILPVFSADFAAAQAGLFWWEGKASDRPAAVFRKKPARLALCHGKFQRAGQGGNATGGTIKLNSVKAWIRSPDGSVSKAGLTQEKETVALHFPSGLNPVRLNGIYLVCARMDARSVDINSDGRNETVHYYSKYLIYHQSNGGIRGNKQDVFFKDAEKISLEIGPFDDPGTGEKASCVNAGYQEARKKHRMKVLYNEKPLADVRVAILTESGWEKMVKTDAEGTFSILPVEDKEKTERCLYTVAYKDPSTGKYHSSNLSMVITAPSPLWMSRAGGFDFWAAIGSGLFIVYMIWTICRKVKRDKKTMLEFESHRIRRD